MTAIATQVSFDLFVEQRFKAFPAENLPASLAGIAPRDLGIDLGMAYRLRQSWGTLRAELVRDVGSASRGYEARLGYGYDYRSGRWSLRPDVSVSWRDARLNNYYYGVRAARQLLAARRTHPVEEYRRN